MREYLLSLIYRLVRYQRKKTIFNSQKSNQEILDLEAVVDSGLVNLETLLKINLCKEWIYFPVPERLKTEVFDLEFASPITFAAYESHLSIVHMFYLIGIGGGCIKTMMSYPREGNKRPRLQEIVIDQIPCLINALGLPGKGVEATIREVLISEILSFKRPIGLSIGGETLEEYKQAFVICEEIIKNRSEAFYYELNISCPSTDGGQSLIKQPEKVEQCLQFMRQQTQRVISVKVSPDQTNTQLLEMAESVSSIEKVMINAGNTQFKRCEEVGLEKNRLTRGGGGVSGSPCFKRTLEMCELLKHSRCPIMATGGIDSVDKIKAVRSQGATLIGMATALVFDPFFIVKANKQL